MPLFAALLLGLVAGSRSMLAPAITTRAARSGALRLQGTPLAFLGSKNANIIFAALAVGELIADKLPFIPSRKSPVSFIGRIVSGALSGASAGSSDDLALLAAIVGAAGAVAGTLGGSSIRSALARLLGGDLPAALLEDLTAAALVYLALEQLSRRAPETLTQWEPGAA